MKQARQEAGLSLAQVGKGQVTAPAIYLIETGRTRPSLPTLEHIAYRTGKPVEFFLADPSGGTDEAQARLAELEAMVGDGRYGDAIALGQSLLDIGSSAYRLGRIRYSLAIAYLQIAKPERAKGLLAEARKHFEAINDGVMLSECLGAEAGLANLTQLPEALAMAEKALAVCRSLDPVPSPTETRLLGIVAQAHVANHDWARAIGFYQQAIKSAGPMFDLRRLAKMYSDLSSAYKQLGQVDTASRYATRSMALLEVLRDRASLARSENDLGLVLLAQGDRTEAQSHLEQSLQLANPGDLQVGRSGLLLSLCELCLEKDNLAQAGTFAQEALQLAQEHDEAANVAEAHAWLGRLADRAGDGETTDREFALAIQGFERLDTTERLFQCHGVYAEILEKRGDVAKAYTHMKKALQASRPRRHGARVAGEERASTA